MLKRILKIWYYIRMIIAICITLIGIFWIFEMYIDGGFNVLKKEEVKRINEIIIDTHCHTITIKDRTEIKRISKFLTKDNLVKIEVDNIRPSYAYFGIHTKGKNVNKGYGLDQYDSKIMGISFSNGKMYEGEDLFKYLKTNHKELFCHDF